MAIALRGEYDILHLLQWATECAMGRMDRNTGGGAGNRASWKKHLRGGVPLATVGR